MHRFLLVNYHTLVLKMNYIDIYVPKTVPLKQYEHNKYLLHQLIKYTPLNVRNIHLNTYFYKVGSHLIFVNCIILCLSFYSFGWQNKLYLIVKKHRKFKKIIWLHNYNYPSEAFSSLSSGS